MIRNFSFAKRRCLIPMMCVILLTGGLLMWNPMAEKGKITGGETLVVEPDTPASVSEPSDSALPEKPALAPHTDIPEKLLACGRWTIDDIRAHPAEIVALLSGTAETDPAGVREWLLSSDHPAFSVNQKANILSGIARVASMEDLLRDATAISNGDAAAHDVYIRSAITVAGVGGNNPEATIAIILAADSLNEDQKGFGTQMLSTFWSSDDLVRASNWVAGLPEGSVRDRAIFGMLNTIHNGRLNMPEAEQWANSISDEKLRESALKNFIRRE